MLLILHAGQTGVERGAHLAASAAGLGIAGFMPSDRRDEMGPLPAHVVERLTVCPERGQRPPAKANITIASAALVVVPDVTSAQDFPAMRWIFQTLRGRHVPILTSDPQTNALDVASWIMRLPASSGSVRLLVTGPRATRWTDGESITRRLVTAIAVAHPSRIASFAPEAS